MMICFVKTGNALIPEADAYSNYLKKKGIESVICESENDARKIKADLYYRFGGLLTHKINNDIPEIHEYHSISTGRFPIFKNFIKTFFSCRPVYLSFLNEYVESKFFFSKRLPVFYRDMGVDNSFFDLRSHQQDKVYDFAYFGSISARKHLLSTIFKLTDHGFSIVLGGPVSVSDRDLIVGNSNINYVGVCSHDAVKEFLSRSKAGLNYIPDEYPLTHQTSTKVIEYLVAGIPIVSNHYHWINDHSKRYGYDFIKLDDVFSEDISMLDFPATRSKLQLPINVAEKFTWDFILDNCCFDQIVTEATCVS